MRFILPVILLLSFQLGKAQSLPIYFESDIVNEDFVDFDGGMGSVVDNPVPGGINSSSKVGQIIRNGGLPWSGSKIFLDANLDFEVLNTITMKVYSTAPVGTVVKLKLEGSGADERDALTSVSGEWEELTWDFTGVPTNYNTLVFMFDFGNVGNGSESSTFYFDDIEQFFGGLQLDLPVTFEETTINYNMTDFGSTVSTLVIDPTDEENHVMRVIKTIQSPTWGGTTIGTPSGFASDIPLTLNDSIMSVRVWSPQAGVPVRLKVEDSDDPTHTCETETLTTVAEEWEVLEFDFTNEAEGTQPLSIGLGFGWTFNMASIFFNFGTEGALAGEQTYYFDDVVFGEYVPPVDPVGITESVDHAFSIFPNPSQDRWNIFSYHSEINNIEIYDMAGKLVQSQAPQSNQAVIDGRNLKSGIYVAQVSCDEATTTIRLVKE